MFCVAVGRTQRHDTGDEKPQQYVPLYFFVLPLAEVARNQTVAQDATWRKGATVRLLARLFLRRHRKVVIGLGYNRYAFIASPPPLLPSPPCCPVDEQFARTSVFFDLLRDPPPPPLPPPPPPPFSAILAALAFFASLRASRYSQSGKLR